VPLPIVARITCATVLLRRPASRRRRGELRRRRPSWESTTSNLEGEWSRFSAPLKRGAPLPSITLRRPFTLATIVFSSRPPCVR
jgi:hypothetical protein